MIDMKCPFCQQELVGEGSDNYWCKKCNLERYRPALYGSQKLWQELIYTRKALEQSETCCSEWEIQALDYKAENIALSGELERTRKALDVALDWLEQVATLAKCDDDLCREFTKRKLTEIKTALEQKN